MLEREVILGQKNWEMFSHAVRYAGGVKTRRQQHQYKYICYICVCIFYQYLGTFDFGWPAEVIREYKY